MPRGVVSYASVLLQPRCPPNAADFPLTQGNSQADSPWGGPFFSFQRPGCCVFSAAFILTRRTLMTASLNRAMRRITKGNPRRQWVLATALCGLTLLAAQWARAQDKAAELVGKVTGHVGEAFHFFSFMTSDHYSGGEKMALWIVLGVAFAGLGYALMLVKQVREADQGTPKMQKVAAAIREGAEAYLKQQFGKIVVLIGILTVALFFTALAGTGEAKYQVAFGRAVAFLMGSLFSF